MRALRESFSGREQRAKGRIHDEQRRENWMHECSEHRTADQELKREKAAPAKLPKEQKRVAHVNDVGL